MAEERKYLSLLVRVWQEPPPDLGQDPGWQGEIEHIQTGEVFTIDSKKALFSILRQMVNEAGWALPRRKDE